MANSDHSPRPDSEKTGDHSTPEFPVDHEDNTDGKPLWDPQSWWEPIYIKQQNREGMYLFVLLIISLFVFSAISLGGVEKLLMANFALTHDRVDQFISGLLLSTGGLLGGTVYGGKWLYHSVARGLWNQDRRLWRLLSPWMSLGTTVGVWSLLFSGISFESNTSLNAETKLLGIGFLIGYFSDRFLAKMKEIANVLFGHVDR